MNSYFQIDLIVSVAAVVFLALVLYVGFGLWVLDTLEDDPRVQRMTDWIDGLTAWLLFAVWPLTAAWLFVCARLDRRNA